MKRKIILYLFLTFLVSGNCFALQNYDTTRAVHFCERIASNELDTLYECFTSNNFEQFEKTMDNWTRRCGMSELPLRLIILKSMIKNEEVESKIELYYNLLYPLNLINRYNNSKKYYYDYVFFYNKSYYSYVNLRHKIDTLVKEKATELLQTNALDTNKLIICNFFADNMAEVSNYIYKDEAKFENLKNLFIDIKEKKIVEAFHFSFNIGNYAPIGGNDIFCNSFMFGISFGAVFKNTICLDFALRLRINNGDKDFHYIVNKEKKIANSPYSAYGGIFVGYKIFDSKYLKITPKFGGGIETVSTGIEIDKKDNLNEKEDINIVTMHLSTGLSIRTQLDSFRHLGLEANFHYCPYQWDNNLKTNFKNFAFSIELCYSFYLSKKEL